MQLCCLSTNFHRLFINPFLIFFLFADDFLPINTMGWLWRHLRTITRDFKRICRHVLHVVSAPILIKLFDCEKVSPHFAWSLPHYIFGLSRVGIGLISTDSFQPLCFLYFCLIFPFNCQSSGTDLGRFCDICYMYTAY